MTLTVSAVAISLYFSVLLIHTLIVDVLILTFIMLLCTTVSAMFYVYIIFVTDTTRIWYSNPFPGIIRLQGGSYSNEGRVEVYCNGQ